jgi:tetratricopeptide (TPR) repeat protein
MVKNRLFSAIMPLYATGYDNPTAVIRRVDRIRCLLAFILAFCIFGPLNCTEEPSAELDEGLALYRQNQLDEALPIFERVAGQDDSNPDALAWLAETYRRLGRFDEAVEYAEKAIEIDPCHSFSHTILADALNPMYSPWKKTDRDKAWSHLLKAVECDPADGNAWLSIRTEAIYRGDRDLEKKALRSFVETGILTPVVLAYNRWMLRHVPENAILLTNGDMDTYPAVALQEVENFRTDVAIVNYSLLNTPWYARYVRDKYAIQLPFSDSELDSLKPYQTEDGTLVKKATQMMKSWLEMREGGELDNPIAISVTVGDLSFAGDSQDHLVMMGAFRLWQPSPAESPMDTSGMRESLAGIDPDEFAGSLVSEKDRSSVRIASTNRIVTNITELALKYSKTLLESGNPRQAYEMLTWAEEFEQKTVLGPCLSDQIEELKETARQQMD